MALAHAARPQPRRQPSRYRQIVEILVRHGLGYMIGAIEPPKWVPVRGRSSTQTRPGERCTPPERLRRAIEELGPTFIKLGQILSTRGDLLPRPYLDELAMLQDGAPPIPPDQVHETLLAELGRPIEDAFATFDMTPLASASIGQAHTATLLDGTEVVVKLRRPNVVERVEEDLHILLSLAAKASHHGQASEFYDLVGITQEFAQTLRQELDYLHEGHNVERFAANFADDPGVRIPRVYWETTTARMLTLERIRGIKISDVEALETAGLDRREVAEHASRILLTMILEQGFFHADPHPGNIFVEADGRVALIDFGMTGQVEGHTRELLIQLMLSISRQDASRLADVVLELGMARAHVDRNALRRDLQRVLARYYGRPLGDVKFSAFLGELLDIIRRFHLRLPSDLALLIKTLAMCEGLGVRLDPMFDFMTVYAPYAEQVIRRQFSFQRWAGQLALAGIDAMDLWLQLPQRLGHILGDIERGGFEINVQPQSFEPYLNRLEQLVNRLILGILAAAWTISVGLFVAAYHPAGLGFLSGILFLLVLALGAGFGNYVLFLTLRNRRRAK